MAPMAFRASPPSLLLKSLRVVSGVKDEDAPRLLGAVHEVRIYKDSEDVSEIHALIQRIAEVVLAQAAHEVCHSDPRGHI